MGGVFRDRSVGFGTVIGLMESMIARNSLIGRLGTRRRRLAGMKSYFSLPALKGRLRALLLDGGEEILASSFLIV